MITTSLGESDLFTVGVITHESELSPLQLRSVFRTLGYQSPPTESFELPAHHCLAIWAVMLLGRLKFLDMDQRNLLFEELFKQIDEELTTGITTGAIQTPMVVIADGRYATWHNRAGWLDLSNGETLTSPNTPPLETLAYNLAVLFLRNRAACETIKRKVAQDGAPSNT